MNNRKWRIQNIRKPVYKNQFHIRTTFSVFCAGSPHNRASYLAITFAGKKIQYFRTLHWACLTFETVHITKKLQLSSSSLYKQRDFVLRLDLHVTILLFERGRQTDGYCALYKFLICPMQGGKPSWQPGISVSVYVHYLPRNVCDFRVVVQTNLRWTGDVSGLGKLIIQPLG